MVKQILAECRNHTLITFSDRIHLTELPAPPYLQGIWTEKASLTLDTDKGHKSLQSRLNFHQIAA